MKKKAVIIMGLKNSGKTTTIETFLCKYGRGYPYRQLRNGKHYFKQEDEWSVVWIQGQSPSEAKTRLEDCKAFNKDAELFIVAEQSDGLFKQDTLNTLKKYNFTVTIFEIDGDNSLIHWKRQNESNRKLLQMNRNMQKRADDIFNVF